MTIEQKYKELADRIVTTVYETDAEYLRAFYECSGVRGVVEDPMKPVDGANYSQFVELGRSVGND